MPQRTARQYATLTLKGFCMGCADVIPGVSGGTMAFILGIYRELISAIRSFDLELLRLILQRRWSAAAQHAAWPFLLAVGCGILLAVFTLARLLSWLLANRPVLIWSFFFGLIVASVLTVGRSLERWSPGAIAGLMLGAAGTYSLVGLMPATTSNAAWFLFLCGAVAICAMILPGISGAFILVLLGKYQTVLEAVNQRDLTTLLLVAAGAVVGIMAFSRLLGWLFERYRDFTVAVLTGLMVGSLRKIWPWKEALEGLTKGDGSPLLQRNVLPPEWSGEVAAAFGLCLIGFGVVLTMEVLSRKVKQAPEGKGAA